ncbi:hypothetical protein DERP_004165 [Dermatophagoides pteronyssinus]|uniref:Uncharacterized protein n=1 Tax=Dermatophagoides pteronyssinus TaxID=6956 RepID=A0ABQ8J8E4_DERPT|nr:hypothetical protein DERP_004165 [Dermatophagoides pteronyssinus]
MTIKSSFFSTTTTTTQKRLSNRSNLSHRLYYIIIDNNNKNKIFYLTEKFVFFSNFLRKNLAKLSNIGSLCKAINCLRQK